MSELGVACRSCGHQPLEPVLSLGEMPLVNAFAPPDANATERRYPLETVRCPICTLVQITETIPPEVLFRQYAYFSSYSTTFLEHARRYATRSIAALGLDRDSLVVEAASNDGYLLQYFGRAGVRALGIEPAENVAEVARTNGVETIAAFLDEELASTLIGEHGTADLVIANNVLAHVPDLHGFLRALSILAGERGEISVEAPYLIDLVDGLEFDTIYHEHVCYFSLTALKALADVHGLVLREVEAIPVHGGSIRVTLAARGEPDPSVREFLAAEEAWGVRTRRPYDRFALRVAAVRAEVHELVSELVAGGASVAAYGAAAKGVVLANACGLDISLVAFVADRNPTKQGRLLPGVGIPVREPAALELERPDYCLLFAWNLADEIIEQESGYARLGGRFIVPLPSPRVVGA